MSLLVEREITEPLEEEGWVAGDYMDMRVNVDAMLAQMRNTMRRYEYAADAYPNMSMELGPGSLAPYLGVEPKFAANTVWYPECVHDGWGSFPLNYDENNHWWKLHYDMFKKAAKSSGGDFYINIPVVIENMDVLAQMRGTTALCYDLIDEPEIIKERLGELCDLSFKYFVAFYDLVKDSRGGNSFTAFQVWGPGRTAAVTCDFNTVMSPGQFREIVIPTITKQCRGLDFSMFHLDGPDAARHLPSLMEIECLDALQWTPGVSNAFGGDEKWYPIYDKAHEAGKSIWIPPFKGGTPFSSAIDTGGAQEVIEKARKLVKRYGVGGLYFIMPVMNRQCAEMVIKAASTGFK